MKNIFLTFLHDTTVLWIQGGMLNLDPHVGLKNIYSKFIPRICSMTSCECGGELLTSWYMTSAHSYKDNIHIGDNQLA